MTVKRIDQLTAHPRTAAQPFRNINTGAHPNQPPVIVLRDPDLASDNTRRIPTDAISPYPEVNVKNFGALGDGATDDTAAIQAAIDSIGGQMPTVFIPPGLYYITQIIIPQGITLRGSGTGLGGTILRQPQGTDKSAIISNPSLNGSYIHYTRVMDFQLQHSDGLGLTSTDRGSILSSTSGCGIWFPNFCGEGTKFENLLITGFPEHGIRVNGAITCWFQDLALFNNGVSQEAVDNGYHPGPAIPGYGLYLYNAAGFTGHYVLGISGDNNNTALIGAADANVTIMGVKAECHAWQNYVVDLDAGTNGNWCILNGVTASLNADISPRPSGIVHIKGSSPGYQVWLTGISRHTGAIAPTNKFTDTVAGRTIALEPAGAGTTNRTTLMDLHTHYTSAVGEAYHANMSGAWIRTGSDPTTTATSVLTFALGHTNGAGTGTATTSLAAISLGTGTSGPASFTVSKWVHAQLDGKHGWVAWFGAT